MDLGWMLYDVFDLGATGHNRSRPSISLFHAFLRRGILEIPGLFESSGKKIPGGGLMLAQLRKYAEDRGMVSEPGFMAKTVHYVLDIDADGHGATLIPLGDGKGKLCERCPNLSQPEMIAGGIKRSQFLVESVAVLFY
jgi:hypothetical protein